LNHAAVDLDQVFKSFGSIVAVDCLSASVPAGAIYGFLGPNGAGKTTTLRMMLNIISPDRGRIEILGHPSTKDNAARTGYMPEERGLYRKMKVRDVLTYFAALKGMERRRLAGAAAEWLDRVELGQWAERRVEDLSRGMQQKLQFAVTVIHEPDLLILDEPFSGLDPVNLELLRDIMLSLRQEGKTVIFSTHMMEQAERLCDFILLINQGRKVIDGTLDQVRSQYQSHAVLAQLEGDGAFVETLPMVSGVSRQGRALEISLREGADSQELLQALVGRVRVRSFAEKAPSLHEIFVHLVGRRHE